MGVPVTAHSTATTDHVCASPRKPGVDWKADLLDLRARVREIARVTSVLSVPTSGSGVQKDDGLFAGVGLVRMAAVAVAAVYSACATFTLAFKGSTTSAERRGDGGVVGDAAAVKRAVGENGPAADRVGNGDVATSDNDDESDVESEEMMFLEEEGTPRLPPCRASGDTGLT